MRNDTAKKVAWVGIVLILLTGLIHLIEGPEYLEEATYVGVLFFLNSAGSLVAALGIYRGVKSWGWGLGLLIAAGAFIAYVISRTIGLPGRDRGMGRTAGDCLANRRGSICAAGSVGAHTQDSTPPERYDDHG